MTENVGASNSRNLKGLHGQYRDNFTFLTTSVDKWSEFLATDPEVPGSIRGATRFSEK
jgi:hypothetical protein